MAKNTRKAYESALGRYVKFLSEHHLILPGRRFREPSETDLLYFAVYCDQRLDLAPGTINATLSGLAHFCKVQVGRSPLQDPTGEVYPRLQSLLRALKKSRSQPKRERLPVTTDLLRQVQDLLRRDGGPDDLTYQAAFAAGTYGLLRVSEFTCPKSKEFDPTRHANFGDMQVVDGAGGSQRVELTIRASKTDVFRRQHLVAIHPTGKDDCPVRLLAQHLEQNRTRAADSPLFVMEDGTYLTRTKVTAKLRECLERLGLRGNAYASHSFRIGGCVSLAAAGAPTHIISTLGRWKSTCYLDYLQLTHGVLAATYRQLGDVTPRTVATRGHLGRR